jgi:hypothetical protein
MSKSEIEKELELYRQDGIVGLYYSLNKKLNQLSQAIDSATIEFSSKDDKSFERLMKSMVDSKLIAENMKWLRTEFALTGDEEKDKNSARRPLIEELSRNARQEGIK